MILSDLFLPTRQNQIWSDSGMDSIEHCSDKKHFKSYPHTVEYKYNSRGFRDHEWPDDLKNAVWCLGDSFTVGLGCPLEHTWPYLLQKRQGARTINVSMDGASNDWIARRSLDILQQIAPDKLIIHWSHVNRREISTDQILARHGDQSIKEIYAVFKQTDWPDCNTMVEFQLLPVQIQQQILPHWSAPAYTDEERRLNYAKTTVEQDLQNLVDNITKVELHKGSTKIIHSFIPDFLPVGSDSQATINLLKKDLDICAVDHFVKLDLGRDGHHYDIITADYFVKKLAELLV